MRLLIPGKYYWLRHKVEKIWRPAYVGLDHDNNKWLHILGHSEPYRVKDMELVYFDIRELKEPE